MDKRVIQSPKQALSCRPPDPKNGHPHEKIPRRAIPSERTLGHDDQPLHSRRHPQGQPTREIARRPGRRRLAYRKPRAGHTPAQARRLTYSRCEQRVGTATPSAAGTANHEQPGLLRDGGAQLCHPNTSTDKGFHPSQAHVSPCGTETNSNCHFTVFAGRAQPP